MPLTKGLQDSERLRAGLQGYEPEGASPCELLQDWLSLNVLGRALMINPECQAVFAQAKARGFPAGMHWLEEQDSGAFLYFVLSNLVLLRGGGDDTEGAVGIDQLPELPSRAERLGLACLHEGAEDVWNLFAVAERAAAGSAKDCSTLGARYQAGAGVPTDERRGMAWLERAAMLGHEESKLALAMSWADGVMGVSRASAAMALALLNELACRRDAGAMHYMAQAFHSGKLSEHPFMQAPKTGCYLYCYAAAHGSLEAIDVCSRLRKQKSAHLCIPCDTMSGDTRDPDCTFQCCAGCKACYYMYCSKECQVSHWKKGGHKKVCKQIQALRAQRKVDKGQGEEDDGWEQYWDARTSRKDPT
jgi:hypothetical protein